MSDPRNFDSAASRDLRECHSPTPREASRPSPEPDLGRLQTHERNRTRGSRLPIAHLRGSRSVGRRARSGAVIQGELATGRWLDTSHRRHRPHTPRHNSRSRARRGSPGGLGPRDRLGREMCGSGSPARLGRLGRRPRSKESAPQVDLSHACKRRIAPRGCSGRRGQKQLVLGMSGDSSNGCS